MSFTIFKNEKIEIEDVDEQAEAALLPWIRGGQILHIWDKIDTIFVVVQFKSEIHFLRAFPIGDRWHVSQDQVVS